MQDYEKLGAFYLGSSYDLEEGARQDDLILYDAKDLTTHAMIIGMTGSGKTGLGIGMIEEAAIDPIPVIAVDPKGDLGNLLLTFPGLSSQEFRPWVNPQEAAEKGVTADAPEAELQREVDTIDSGFDALSEPLEQVTIAPKSADIHILFVGLAWAPHTRDAQGRLAAA